MSSQDPERWMEAETPLLEVILAAYTDNIGSEPGQMPFDQFRGSMAEAFPHKPAESFDKMIPTGWAARNVIANEISHIEPGELCLATEALAQLACGVTSEYEVGQAEQLMADTILKNSRKWYYRHPHPKGKLIAHHFDKNGVEIVKNHEESDDNISEHYGTAQRFESQPLLKILSSLAVAHMPAR